jgi:ABC-type sulfate transport system substrate-binding protein
MYMAVKSPQMRDTEVLLTAYAPCGNVCKPYCKTFHNEYKHCDGSVKVTAKQETFTF